jgi:hypothetical protein
MPSLRSSLARVSRPKSLAAPPAAWASDIQVAVRMPGCCAVDGRLRAAGFRAAGLRAGVLRAREDDLVLDAVVRAAMRSTVLARGVKARE